MNAQDTKRLIEIAGLLGSTLKEVEGLVEKYETPKPQRKRRNLKQERKEKYLYLLQSGKMKKKKAYR